VALLTRVVLPTQEVRRESAAPVWADRPVSAVALRVLPVLEEARLEPTPGEPAREGRQVSAVAPRVPPV